MSQFIYPILFAMFVWWFSTGVILYLDGLPRHTFRWSMAGATAVLVASLYGLAHSSGDTRISSVYCSFTCAVLIWGWLEISFYMGVITGPRTEACEEGCHGWRHFAHAIETILYHELAIIAAAAIIMALAWNGPNHTGIWTFMVLWWMHESAKLNIFLGVRNLSEEFLPDHLQFLRSFMTRKPMNLLFPFSVSISTVIAWILIQHAGAASGGPYETAGYTFLATMMVLAILEHWFLVLPLPFAALWKWGLKSHTAQIDQTSRIVIIKGTRQRAGLKAAIAVYATGGNGSC